ncbi:MAG: phosphodiesterase family [Bacillota bacterium]|nr:MAG: phosphodiesterase family [Bacillota bacterium]MBS3950890.1 metallophosphoesterase family protein [Peptococcaceae bacterium]
MRFAIISDIHSNIHALCAVLADIDKQDIERIYCLGDNVGYGAFPNEVVAELRGREIIAIQGNYDESVGEELITCGCDFADGESARLGEISNNWSIDNTTDENKEWLRNLPRDLRLQVENVNILVVHGSPRKNNEYLHRYLSEAELIEATSAVDFDVLLCGHTHQPYHRVAKGRHIINPGSVGKPKHGNDNAVYGIIEIKDDRITLTSVEVAYSYAEAAAAIIAAGLPEQFAEALKA